MYKFRNDRLYHRHEWRCLTLISDKIHKGDVLHWIYLILAIIFEVMATLSIKQATLGNTYIWSVIIIVLYIISFSFVYYATKFIELGTVYAIWAGM